MQKSSSNLRELPNRSQRSNLYFTAHVAMMSFSLSDLHLVTISCATFLGLVPPLILQVAEDELQSATCRKHYGDQCMFSEGLLKASWSSFWCSSIIIWLGWGTWDCGTCRVLTSGTGAEMSQIIMHVQGIHSVNPDLWHCNKERPFKRICPYISVWAPSSPCSFLQP